MKTRKISSILKKTTPQFPIKGQNGYAGEQDGSCVMLAGPFYFSSKAHADEKFPKGLPEWIDIHWAKRIQKHKNIWEWEVVFGCWDNEIIEEENPFCWI